MMTTFHRLPEPLQGLIHMTLGVVILLYALGLIKTGVNFLVIALAIYLILNGFIKSGLHHKLTGKKH